MAAANPATLNRCGAPLQFVPAHIRRIAVTFHTKPTLWTHQACTVAPNPGTDRKISQSNVSIINSYCDATFNSGCALIIIVTV